MALKTNTVNGRIFYIYLLTDTNQSMNNYYYIMLYEDLLMWLHMFYFDCIINSFSAMLASRVNTVSACGLARSCLLVRFHISRSAWQLFIATFTIQGIEFQAGIYLRDRERNEH